jgi:hypothetical protein
MRASADVDSRFLKFLTELILCSRCLRAGTRTPVPTPVPQVLSHRHRPLTLCRACRAREHAARH